MTWQITIKHRDDTGGEGWKAALGRTPDEAKAQCRRLGELYPRSYLWCSLPEPWRRPVFPWERRARAA